MKRFYAAVLAMALCLSVASCAQGPDSTESTARPTTEDVMSSVVTEASTTAVVTTETTANETTSADMTTTETTTEETTTAQTQATTATPIPAEPIEKSESVYDDMQQIQIGKFVTLRYNGNTANIQYRVEEGVGSTETVTLEATPCNGFTAKGWSETAAAVNGGAIVSMDLSYTRKVNTPVTLFYNASVNISYYTEPGHTAPDRRQESSAVCYMHPNTLPDEGYFAKEGYILTGYNTKADGTGEHISVGSRAPYYQTGDFDLYCVWEKESDVADFTFEKKGKEAKLLSYSGHDSTVVIPSAYEGLAVTAIAKDAFQNLETLQRVVMGKNITAIEDGAFVNCPELDTWVIYESITSMSDQALQNCPKWSHLYINALNEQPVNSFSTTGNKLDRLVTMGDKRKIMIVGGSGSFYGFRSDRIREAVGDQYDVINLGENMNIPSVFYFEYISHFAKEGDIILWNPEPMSLYITGRTDLTVFFWQFRNDNYDFTKYVDLRQYQGVLDTLAAYIASEKELDMDASDKMLMDVNMYGDNLRPRQHHDEKYYYSFPKISDCPYQNQVMEELQAKGVHIFYTYAAMQKTGAEKVQEKAIQHYEAAISSYPGVTVISKWQDCIIDDKYFWNSAFHLTNEGAVVRTDKVIVDLLAAMENIK